MSCRVRDDKNLGVSATTEKTKINSAVAAATGTIYQSEQFAPELPKFSKLLRDSG